MPRLRNTQSGVVVNVDDDTAARLGSEWEAESKTASKKSASTRKSSSTASDDK
jgi:hypothetical protein